MKNQFSPMNITIYVAFTILFTLWSISVLCRRYRAYYGLQTPLNPMAPAHAHAHAIIPSNQELPCGLDASAIETLPKFPYKGNSGPGLSSRKENVGMTDECGVCLGSYQDKEMLRLLPKCGHVFHADCVDPWLGSHGTCPICRSDLTPGHLSGEMARRAEFRVNVDQGRV